MTHKEQRMIHVHQLGRRDYSEGRPLVVPRYLSDPDERDAYAAGYLGEKRRAEAGK